MYITLHFQNLTEPYKSVKGSGSKDEDSNAAYTKAGDEEQYLS